VRAPRPRPADGAAGRRPTQERLLPQRVARMTLLLDETHLDYLLQMRRRFGRGLSRWTRREVGRRAGACCATVRQGELELLFDGNGSRGPFDDLQAR
jgi:hypothetical protein